MRLIMIFDDLRNLDYPTFYSLIEFWNDLSRKYNLRLNVRSLRDIVYIKLFYIQINITKTVSTGKRKIRVFIHEPRDTDIF